MSSVATGEYYRLLNQLAIAEYGRAPQIALYSVNFAVVEAMIRERRWGDAAAMLADRARRVESAGADFLLLATNTMHVVAPAIEAAIAIPFLHIVDSTAAAARAEGTHTLGVLGTGPVMEPGFYAERFATHRIELVAPRAEHQGVVEETIFTELTGGVVRDESTTKLLRIIDDLVDRGAQGIVLGCTELSLAVKPETAPARVYDTTRLHVDAAIRLAFEMIDPLPART